MVYDTDLADRVRNCLPRTDLISERKMFGSLAFLYQNNMVCGIMEDGLMARVGPDYYEEALEKDFTHEMDLTGRPMKNIVIVSIDALDEPNELEFWITKCMSFVSSLPAKEKKIKAKKPKSKRKRAIL